MVTMKPTFLIIASNSEQKYLFPINAIFISNVFDKYKWYSPTTLVTYQWKILKIEASLATRSIYLIVNFCTASSSTVLWKKLRTADSSLVEALHQNKYSVFSDHSDFCMHDAARKEASNYPGAQAMLIFEQHKPHLWADYVLPRKTNRENSYLMSNLRTYSTKSDYWVLVKEWKSPQQMTCLVTSLQVKNNVFSGDRLVHLLQCFDTNTMCFHFQVQKQYCCFKETVHFKLLISSNLSI